MAEADVERDLPTSPPKKQKEPEVIEVRKGGRIGRQGGGKISEESQGQGAQEVFETSERLSEVI